MKFHGVLVKPLEDQHDRNYHIDPAGVKFDPDFDYPLHFEFDFDQPIGTVRVYRDDDGSLTVEGETTIEKDKFVAAIGCVATDYLVFPNKPGLVRSSELRDVALTRHHADPTQPKVIWE